MKSVKDIITKDKYILISYCVRCKRTKVGRFDIFAVFQKKDLLCAVFQNSKERIGRIIILNLTILCNYRFILKCIIKITGNYRFVTIDCNYTL